MNNILSTQININTTNEYIEVEVTYEVLEDIGTKEKNSILKGGTQYGRKKLKSLWFGENIFSKLTNTLTKIIIPTQVGINSMLISIKRNNVLKTYENTLEDIENVEKKKQ